MAVKRKVRILTDPGGEVSLVDSPRQEDTPLIISERNFHLLRLIGSRRNWLISYYIAIMYNVILYHRNLKFRY